MILSIMMKIYSEGAGGAEMPVRSTGMATDKPTEPTIDEVD